MEGTQLGVEMLLLPAGPSNTDSPTLATEEKEEVLDLDGSCGTDGGSSKLTTDAKEEVLDGGCGTAGG